MSALSRLRYQILAVADAEVRKLRHDPTELVTRAVQPVLWLLLFGQVMAQVRGLNVASGTALSRLSGARHTRPKRAVRRDLLRHHRDLGARSGMLHRYMVSPAPRSALVLGKALLDRARPRPRRSSSIVLALDHGHSGSASSLRNIAGVIVFIALRLGLFSTFSLVIACIVRTRERFMGIGQVLTMPIFFASNAIYPIRLMPRWLQIVSRLIRSPTRWTRCGPDASHHSKPNRNPEDCAVLVASFVVLVAIAARLYPRMEVTPAIVGDGEPRNEGDEKNILVTLAIAGPSKQPGNQHDRFLVGTAGQSVWILLRLRLEHCPPGC